MPTGQQVLATMSCRKVLMKNWQQIMSYFSGGQIMHYENGFNQEEFAEGISMYMSAINADVPDYDAELEQAG